MVERGERTAGASNSSSSRARSSSCQSNQLISLSWQYALLLPRCVRPSSSPPSSIGTPCERRSVVRKLRSCRSRSSLTAGIVGRALDAAVPAAVVVGAVAVVLEVGLVVLLVVRDEVVEREAVVGGDEVDRRGRPAAVRLVEVAGAREAPRELGDACPGRARSRASSRGRCRSTPSRGSGSSRPGSRRARRPTARRSASPARAPDPGGSCRRRPRAGRRRRTPAPAPRRGRSGSRRRGSRSRSSAASP